METPAVWTDIQRYNVDCYGWQALLRVGVFQPAEIMAGAPFIVAWGPLKGTVGPGFCLAPHATIPLPFPYDSDTVALSLDIKLEISIPTSQYAEI